MTTPSASSKIDVSVILACYNAAPYAEESVRQIQDVLDATAYNYELIFVDDKSSDETVPIIKKLIQDKPNCTLYEHTTNEGRGATVCEGLRKSHGEIVGFIDLDLDNPARYIFSMILGLKKGDADIATARRIYEFKFNPYLLIRLFASKTYSWISRMWMQTGLRDTETGCKFFRRDAIMPILDETQNETWFWDTEIMVRSFYKGLKIMEIPTLFIRDTSYSTVNILPDCLRYLHNLWQFWPTQKTLRKNYLQHRKKENIY